MSHTVVEGWGIQMYRLCAWRRAAAMNMGPLKLRGATLGQWRHQMGSAARTWRQVHAEAEQLVAVWTMCRLMETAFMYDLVEEVAS